MSALSRRDQVNTFKFIFSIFTYVLMAAGSISATFYLVYTHYANPLIEKGREHSIEGFFKYLEKPSDMFLTISYGICSIIAVCFMIFLIMFGIKTLVVKFMMRNVEG